MIELVFTDVSYFDSCDIVGKVDYFSIIDAKVENDIMIINTLDDFNDEHYTIKIQATNVDIFKI